MASIRGWTAGVLAAGMVVCVGSFSAGSKGQADAGTAERTGYCIGFDAGRHVVATLQTDGVAADTEALLRGFADGVKGLRPSIPEAEIGRVLVELERGLGETRAKGRLASDPVFRAVAERNEAEGRVFRERFAEREGAVAMPSGVVYQPVRAGIGGAGTGGSGAAVGGEPGGGVTVNFQAMLTDGTPIAQGVGRTLEIEGLLPGARELVQAMRVGDRWFAAIPPELAYGLAGRGGEIGPNETIMVDVEVVGINTGGADGLGERP